MTAVQPIGSAGQEAELLPWCLSSAVFHLREVNSLSLDQDSWELAIALKILIDSCHVLEARPCGDDK